MAINETIRELLESLPEDNSCRIVADILIAATEEGRLSDDECKQVMLAFYHQNEQLMEAMRDHSMFMDNIIKAHRKTIEVQEVAASAIGWLNDPLVKPVFIFSTWLEAGMNWLFRRKEST
jgi:hypothetical protein